MTSLESSSSHTPKNTASESCFAQYAAFLLALGAGVIGLECHNRQPDQPFFGLHNREQVAYGTNQLPPSPASQWSLDDLQAPTFLQKLPFLTPPQH